LNRKIKLIWDFRSEVAHQIAQNHNSDTKAFVNHKGIDFLDAGVRKVSEYHSLSYLVVEETYMIAVRDALKPHRAELAE